MVIMFRVSFNNNTWADICICIAFMHDDDDDENNNNENNNNKGFYYRCYNEMRWLHSYNYDLGEEKSHLIIAQQVTDATYARRMKH